MLTILYIEKEREMKELILGCECKCLVTAIIDVFILSITSEQIHLCQFNNEWSLFPFIKSCRTVMELSAVKQHVNTKQNPI